MSTTNIGASVLAGSESTTSSGGLGSGIDVSSLVSAALAPQEAELSVLQGEQTTITNEQTALTSFNTDLQALQTAAYALTDPAGQFTDSTATSSDSSILTASATAGAASAANTITVNNLATTSSVYSDPVASSSTTIANGTLSIQVGSNTAVPITIDSTDNTLNGLAQAINNTPNIGVTASVITDANGARLAIVSNTSGAAGNVTVTPSSGGLAFHQGVVGVNASLTVDGIPISSATNTVSSAIPGVTLSLTGADPKTTVSVTTGPDVTAQETAVNNFVSAYNTVMGDLNTQFAVDSSTGEPGVLASDSTLALVQTQLLSSMSFSTTGNGNVNSLADLGITMNNDGTLSVDTGTLSTALEANPSAVQSFFQSSTTGSFGANLTSQLATVADPIAGAVAQDMNGLANSQTDITQQISDFQDQITTQQTQLTTEYDTVDTTLQELPLLLQQTDQQLASLG